MREFKSIDTRYKLLEDKGISVDDYILGFYSELHNDSNMRILSETYMDRKSSLLMDNIHIHSEYLKSIGKAVINYLSCKKKTRDIFSVLRNLEDREYLYHSIRIREEVLEKMYHC